MAAMEEEEQQGRFVPYEKAKNFEEFIRKADELQKGSPLWPLRGKALGDTPEAKWLFYVSKTIADDHCALKGASEALHLSRLGMSVSGAFAVVTSSNVNPDESLATLNDVYKVPIAIAGRLFNGPPGAGKSTILGSMAITDAPRQKAEEMHTEFQRQQLAEKADAKGKALSLLEYY